MSGTAIIVLAAGKGTRMRSGLPKVLHKAAGRSLLGHVLAAALSLAPARAVIVNGPDQPEVEAETRKFLPQASLVIQAERLGTGHAVQQAMAALEGFSGTVLVLYGDSPLLRPATITALAGAVSPAKPFAVLGFEASEPSGYGRLLKDADGRLAAIREELDCSEAEKTIRLANSGVLAITAELLRELLPRLTNKNAKQEYYLTDLAGLAAGAGKPATILTCGEDEVLGVNTRGQLSHVEGLLQARLRAAAMQAGATLMDPATTYFSADTRLGADVVVEPNVFFGPGVEVGDNVTIRAFSHIEATRIAAGASIGPFARLRPGAVIGEQAHVGNFVEVKKSEIGAGAKVNHLTYIGDAVVGAKANIGAGTITCNYDGFDKHVTEIGAGAFIGSNSSLVAPVRIGDGAYVGSGSVVTRDVPDDALALERGEQTLREGWAARFRALKAKAKQK